MMYDLGFEDLEIAVHHDGTWVNLIFGYGEESRYGGREKELKVRLSREQFEELLGQMMAARRSVHMDRIVQQVDGCTISK